VLCLGVVGFLEVVRRLLVVGLRVVGFLVVVRRLLVLGMGVVGFLEVVSLTVVLCVVVCLVDIKPSVGLTIKAAKCLKYFKKILISNLRVSNICIGKFFCRAW
jgi:hypothetical protein